MRIFFTLLYSIVALFAKAQTPQTVTEAIIKTETEFFTTVENLEEAGNGHFSSAYLLKFLNTDHNGSQTLYATTYLKDTMAATLVKNKGFIWRNIRNYGSGQTASYQEHENSVGFGATDVYFIKDTLIHEELKQKNRELMAKNKDTIELPQVKVYYQDLTKTIAGFPCKRAIVYLLYSNGQTGKITVWYNESIKLKHIASTGDPNFLSANKYIGMPANQFNLLAEVKGFPMEYEMKMDKDIYIKVTVTELDLSNKVKDRYFKIPKYHWDILKHKTPWLNSKDAPIAHPNHYDRSNDDY